MGIITGQRKFFNRFPNEHKMNGLWPIVAEKIYEKYAGNDGERKFESVFFGENVSQNLSESTVIAF